MPEKAIGQVLNKVHGEMGPYRILSELGMGGMAVVYRAIDSRIDQEVALKVLLPQFVNDETFLQRFIREGQNTKRLRHPNIVRTYDAGMVDGHYFIAMDIIDGCNLSEYIKASGSLLDFGESIDILSQIAGALDYAHSLGFLHRDIKLTNILISDDGRALLTDFGAAKQISADYTMLTATGQSIGTPSYMSPEQARAEINLDYRTDVYSLGVVAYKLFTGRMPFTADNQPELLYKIVYDEVPDPQLYNVDIPNTIANVLRRALAKQSELRYASAGTFVGAIATSKSWRRNVAEDLSESVDTTTVTSLDFGRKKRGASLVMGAVACIAILLALSSGVRTDDRTSNLRQQMLETTRSIGEVNIQDLELPEIDVTNVDIPMVDIPTEQLPNINVSDLGLTVPDVEMPELVTDGQIDIRNLDLPKDSIAAVWEKIPGTQQISKMGRSAMDMFGRTGKPPLDERPAETQPGQTETQSRMASETLTFSPESGTAHQKRPPLPPIKPSILIPGR